MATLKKILEAARLIERADAPADEPAGTGDADIDAIIRRAARAEAAEPPADAPVDVAPAVAATPAPAGIEEGLAFADIYARQGLTEAPFPVERLLKLVDGLRTLDPATRRAAIMAMDVADETWSMDQVLADADAKVAALRGHQRQLQATADTVVQTNRERVAALESSRDGRVSELRQQIAALEAQIHDAIGTAAADVAKLQSESESNKAALLRETQRIDAHILNLDELVAQFRTPGK
ncbi:MAG: hypothetical protein ACOY82_06120 [Pseudomonadota bacterium]